MPNYELSKTIRPYMLLNFISVAEKFIQSTFTYAEETLPHEIGKVRKWLFCEVILHLHSWGSQEMLGYLQQNVGAGQGQDAQLEAEYREFMRLGMRGFVPVEGLYSEGKTDVYPSKSVVRAARQSFEGVEDPNFFPVFSCDGKFLKALLCIAENQVRAMETVVLETIDALRVDFSQYGIPSISDVRSSPEPGLFRRTKKPVPNTGNKEITVKPMQLKAEEIKDDPHLYDQTEELQDSVFKSSYDLSGPSHPPSKPLSHTKPTPISEEFPEEITPLASGEDLESGEYTFRSSADKDLHSGRRADTTEFDYMSVNSDYKSDVVQTHINRRGFLLKRRVFDLWRRQFLNSEVHYELFKAKQHTSQVFSAFVRRLLFAWKEAAHRTVLDRFILAKTFHRQCTLNKVMKYWAFEAARVKHVELGRATVRPKQHYAESRLALKALYSWRLSQVRMKKKRREGRHRNLAVMGSWLKKVLGVWLDTVRPSKKYAPRKSGKQGLVQDIAEVLGDIHAKEKSLMELWSDTRDRRVRTKSCRTCSKEQARSLSKEISSLRKQLRQLKTRKSVKAS